MTEWMNGKLKVPNVDKTEISDSSQLNFIFDADLLKIILNQGGLFNAAHKSFYRFSLRLS